MAVKLAPMFIQRFFDSNADSLSGGLLYTYIANTVTPLATYIDSAGTTPNTNPIVLDSNGYCDMWLGPGAYKFVLKDANGVEQVARDNISVSGVTESVSAYITHPIADGQAATDLVGQTLDSTLYSSCVFDCEITRGTTVVSNGPLAIQVVNGVPRVKVGIFLSDLAHGVTFSLSTVGTVSQLKAATSVGPGIGKIKLSKIYVPV